MWVSLCYSCGENVCEGDDYEGVLILLQQRCGMLIRDGHLQLDHRTGCFMKLPAMRSTFLKNKSIMIMPQYQSTIYVQQRIIHFTIAFWWNGETRSLDNIPIGIYQQ